MEWITGRSVPIRRGAADDQQPPRNIRTVQYIGGPAVDGPRRRETPAQVRYIGPLPLWVNRQAERPLGDYGRATLAAIFVHVKGLTCTVQNIVLQRPESMQAARGGRPPRRLLARASETSETYQPATSQPNI